MQRISYYTFLFALIFAPLAFGSVEAWSLALLELLCVGACVTTLAASFYSGRKLVTVVGLLPLALLVLLHIVQIIPLPVGVVQLISPEAYNLYHIVNEAGGRADWISLSVDKRETLHELLRLFAYVAFYFCAIQHLSSFPKLKQTLHFVVCLAGGIAFFAIVQEVASPEKIYWFRDVPVNAHPFGPWVNSNQFSGYVEMIWPLALALFLFYRPRVDSTENWRNTLVSVVTNPGWHLYVYFGFAAILLCLAVFVSLCRGGILSLALSGFIFLFLYNRIFPNPTRLAIMALIVLLCGALTWFGWDVIFKEFNASFDSSGHFNDGRLDIWADCWNMIKDFPVIGAGFGTFISLYPLYKTIGDPVIYDHAHNDYIELLTDGGVIGLVLFLWFAGSVIWHIWKMAKRRRDQYVILLGIGGISGLFAILAHALTDFNLHNGAVGLYFFFLCAATVAGVNSRFSYPTSTTLLKTYGPQAKKLGLGVAAVGLLFVLGIQLGSFTAGYYYRSVGQVYINKNLSETRQDEVVQALTKASVFDPFDGFYNYKLAMTYWFLGKTEEVKEQLVTACSKNPLNGTYLQQLGFILPDDVLGTRLVGEGFRRALQKERMVQNYAEWLFWKGKRLEALNLLQERLATDYRLLEKWLPVIEQKQLTRNEIIYILPHSVPAWLLYAQYSEQKGQREEADYFYEGALANVPEDGVWKAEWFDTLISYYQRTGQKFNGLVAIRTAVSKLPQIARYHIALGDSYLVDGITYRAKEEYEKALVIEPGNYEARSRLRRMGFADSY